MSSSYYIVEFDESNEIDIVSSEWLSADKKTCQWPPLKSAQATLAAKNHEKPAESWDWFDVAIMENGRAGN